MDTQTTLPIETAPIKQVKNKKSVNRGINKRMNDYAHLFDHLTSVEEVKKLAETLKFSAASIQEGAALLKSAQEQMEAQQVARGRARTLTVTCRELQKEINLTYMQHLKLVRLFLKGQEGVLEELKANGARERSFDKWLFQVQMFYHSAFSNGVVKKILSDNDVNDKALKAIEKKVDALFELSHDKKQLQQEAKSLTQVRNKAIEDVEKWVSFFRQRARAQFYHEQEKRALLGV